MTDNPRVSLLMSYYAPDAESARLLPRAVASLGRQDGVRIKLHIGCVGGPLPALREIPCGVSVVMSPRRDPSENQPETLNALWRAERESCDYAGVFNADDEWTPNGVAILAQTLRQNPRATVAYGDFQFVRDGVVNETLGNVPAWDARRVSQEPVPGPFALWRAYDAQQVEVSPAVLFDPSYPRCFDHHLWVRLRMRGEFRSVLGLPVGRYTWRSDSLSHRDPSKTWNERIRVREYAESIGCRL